jgi:hypothetical protein
MCFQRIKEKREEENNISPSALCNSPYGEAKLAQSGTAVARESVRPLRLSFVAFIGGASFARLNGFPDVNKSTSQPFLEPETVWIAALSKHVQIMVRPE